MINKIKIGIISDTHMAHEELELYWFDNGVLGKLEQCDILLHAGDFTNNGSYFQALSFFTWYNRFKATKICIAGNHDWFFEKPDYEVDLLLSNFDDIIYLNDSGVHVHGLNIWGTPIQPYFNNWAFNRDESDIKKHWDIIPDDTDVLLVHGPPKFMMDEICQKFRRFNKDPNVGCPLLKNRIEQIKPRLCAFGHIHEQYGMQKVNMGGLFDTIFVNASSVNEDYQPVNLPIFVDLEL